MKAIVTTSAVNDPSPDKEYSYPILMQDANSKLVVLFTSETEGVVLGENGKPNYKFGRAHQWMICTDAREWLPYKGMYVITIENK